MAIRYDVGSGEWERQMAVLWCYVIFDREVVGSDGLVLGGSRK